MTALRSNEKKMVKRGILGASYSYYPICNIDDIALRAARTEFYTEAGHGNSIGCYGHEYLRRADRPSFSVEPACTRCSGSAAGKRYY